MGPTHFTRRRKITFTFARTSALFVPVVIGTGRQLGSTFLTDGMSLVVGSKGNVTSKLNSNILSLETRTATGAWSGHLQSMESKSASTLSRGCSRSLEEHMIIGNAEAQKINLVCVSTIKVAGRQSVP